MNKSKIISDVSLFIQKSLQHKGEYLTEIKGKPLWVHPQVLSPQYSYSSRFIMHNWNIPKESTVLDMGTGTGVLALFAALKGAKHVVAVDINPHACSIAEKNVKENKVSDRVKVIQSDLYNNVKKEKFDRIIFNAPYWNNEPNPSIPLTYAVFDKNYLTLRRFLKESKEYLNINGKIILSFSTQGEIDLIRLIIAKSRFIIEKEIQETKGHTRVLFYLSL